MRSPATVFAAVLVSFAATAQTPLKMLPYPQARKVDTVTTYFGPRRGRTKAGHGAGRSTAQVIGEQTDKWAFMFQNMGLTPYQNN